jgi:lipid A 3-O-deacylase
VIESLKITTQRIDMKKVILSTLLPLIVYSNAQSLDEVTLSIGESRDGIKIYRAGVRRAFESKWLQSSYGYLSGYYELSLNYWKGKKDKNLGIALSPVFAYYLDFNEIKPFFEVGIGASLFKDSKIDNRDLSTNFLFEDRIGVGVKYKNLELSFRFMHYSNGSIKEPNDGIDIWIGSLSYKF